MKTASPPWCLHWEPGGELDPSDRRDLLIVLTAWERGWAQQLLSEAHRPVAFDPPPKG